MISGLHVVARIYAHNLAAGFLATLRRCEDQQQEKLCGKFHCFQMFVCIRFLEALELLDSSLNRSATAPYIQS